MEQDSRLEALSALNAAYEAERKRMADTQKGIMEQLEQVRQNFDALIEAVRHDSGAAETGYALYQDAVNRVQDSLAGGSPDTGTEFGERTAQLEQELTRFQEATAAAEERIRGLEGRLEAGPEDMVTREIKDLEENLAKRNETINIARHRILRLQEKIEGMAAERTAALQRVADLEMQLERKNAALQTSEDRFSELRRKFDLKMGGNEAVSAQMQALENQLEEKNKLLSFNESRVDEIRVQADSKATELARLEERNHALAAQADEDQRELRNAEERIAKLQEDVAALREMKDLEGRESSESPESEGALRDAEVRFREAQSRINALEEANSRLEEQIKALEAEGVRRDEENRVALAERGHSTEALEQALLRISSLENDLGERDASIDRAEQRADGAEATLERLMSQTRNKEEEFAALVSEAESRKVRAEQLEIELQKAIADLSETRELAENSARSEAEARTALQNLAADAEETQEKLRLLQVAKEEAAKEVEAARNACREKTSEVEHLAMQLGICDQERVEANAALAELRKEIEQLRVTSYDALSEKDAALMQVAEFSERTERLDRALQESPTSQQLSELQQQLDEERKRADMIQEILDEELARGTKANLARQLADALRESEEAREELRLLRRQSEAPRLSESLEVPAETSPSPAFSAAALFADIPVEKRRNLAETLAAANLVGQEQLAEAVQEQKQRPGSSLASVLLDKKLVQPEILAEIISLLTDVPIVSLEDVEIEKDVISLIPPRIARMRHCIPVRADDQEIEVAMESPMDLLAIEDIERATGLRVVPRVALRSQLEKALEAHFPPVE